MIMAPREILRLLLVACLFTSVSSATVGKRAIPNTSYFISFKNKTVGAHDGQKMDIKPESQCPAGHLLQKHGNKNVCCRPTVCTEGFEIKPCGVDGGKDECVACGKGYLQLDTISSFNMTEAFCFPDPYLDNGNYCSSDDLKKSNYMPDNCAVFCECKTESCYIGNPCGCTRVDPCGINQQLNKHTHKCEPCPPFSYKHVEGCGRCVYNLTQFSQGVTFPLVQQIIAPSVQHGFTAEGNSTPAKHPTAVSGQEDGKDSSQQILIILTVVLIVFTFLVLLVLLALLIRCYRKSLFQRNLSNKMSDHEQSPPVVVHESPTESRPLLNEGKVTQGISPTENHRLTQNSAFSDRYTENPGEKESNITVDEHRKRASFKRPIENPVHFSQILHDDNGHSGVERNASFDSVMGGHLDMGPISETTPKSYSNSSVGTSELFVGSLDVNTCDTNTSNRGMTANSETDQSSAETKPKVFDNSENIDNVMRPVVTCDKSVNIQTSLSAQPEAKPCDTSFAETEPKVFDNSENIDNVMRPVVTCDKSVNIQTSLSTQPEAKSCDKSFAKKPLLKEGTPKAKPTAWVSPVTRKSDDMRSESSGASTITSYPSVEHPSINSISSFGSSFQNSSNNHEGQGLRERNFDDSQGEELHHQYRAGQSLQERNHDMMELKETVLDDQK